MISLARDSWLTIGLLLLLIVVTIAAAIQQTQEAVAPPLASFSSAPQGARALWLWLDELGYPVNQEPDIVFQPPEDTSLVLILEPSVHINLEEWEILDTWIEDGGTLLLVGEAFNTGVGVRHYQFRLNYLSEAVESLTPQTPLWASPPASPANHTRTRAYFETSRDDFVVHLAAGERPVVLSFEQGQGRVILSAAPFPLTNAGLKEQDNSALVLNLIGAAARTGSIWFDEWHHGLRSNQFAVAGPWDWLRYTPAGHSLLYTATIIFLATILRGRHFGRPVPLSQETSRRAPLEYISAIANLNHRARHRTAVLSQYRHWLKRGLGQRYRLDPTLPDVQYLDQLAQFNPGLDIIALRDLLARLNRTRISENDLLHLAGEVAGWLEEK